jgi:acyl-CoA synthetase (AMP-forming)/AMP-acid ligase II
MSLPQLIDRATAVAAVLAEMDVHRNEQVLIMLPEGPGFTESFASAVGQDALPLPVSPLLSAPELAATAEAAGARLVLAFPDQLSTLAKLTAEPAILINGPRAVGSRGATAMSTVPTIVNSRTPHS